MQIAWFYCQTPNNNCLPYLIVTLFSPKRKRLPKKDIFLCSIAKSQKGNRLIANSINLFSGQRIEKCWPSSQVKFSSLPRYRAKGMRRRKSCKGEKYLCLFQGISRDLLGIAGLPLLFLLLFLHTILLLAVKFHGSGGVI